MLSLNVSVCQLCTHRRRFHEDLLPTTPGLNLPEAAALPSAQKHEDPASEAISPPLTCHLQTASGYGICSFSAVNKDHEGAKPGLSRGSSCEARARWLQGREMPAGFSESSPANRAWNLDPDLNPSQPLRLQRLVSRETIVPSGVP